MPLPPTVIASIRPPCALRPALLAAILLLPAAFPMRAALAVQPAAEDRTDTARHDHAAHVATAPKAHPAVSPAGAATALPQTDAAPAAPPVAPSAVPASPTPLTTPSPTVPNPERVLIETLARAGTRLVAGGLDGLLLLSDDNGSSWRQVPLPVSATLTQVRFADDRIGWAVGHYGVVLRTQDGGKSWSLVETGPAAVAALVAAARAGNDADSVRARKIATAEALGRDDPAAPFLLIQTQGPDLVRLIGAGVLADESTDAGRSWRPWTDGVGNQAGARLDGLAEQDGMVLAVGAHGTMLAGRPEDGLHAVASPYDGAYFGVLSAPGYGFVAFGQQGHALATTSLGPDWAPPRPVAWHAVSDPSQTTLTAGLVRQGGETLIGDASGAVWRLAGKPETPRLELTPAQAPFPILAMAEADDHALLLAGAGGIIRVPAPAASPAPPAP